MTKSQRVSSPEPRADELVRTSPPGRLDTPGGGATSTTRESGVSYVQARRESSEGGSGDSVIVDK